jgi:hypothetical protein
VSKSAVWVPSTWYLAETLHVTAGVAIIFAGGVKLNLLTVLICFVGITAIKEFVIDVSRFENDSWSGSMQDFLAYMIGAVCGLLALGAFWVGVVAAACAISALFLYDLLWPE